MPHISENRITFDSTDFLSGLAENYVSGLTDVPPVLNGNKLASASNFNPYVNVGYARPGLLPSDVTNVSAITSIILNGVVGYESSTANAYLISAGSRLHKLTLSNSTIANSGVWPHTITGAGAITGSDVIRYRVGTNNRIFYSYEDSTNGYNIGMYNLDGATFDDDYMSTVPAAVGSITWTNTYNPIPMKLGSDDLLYFANGNLLHAFDGQTGANGTTYAAVLTLPSGYKITSMALTPTYLVIFAYEDSIGVNSSNLSTRSTAKAFFWDYLSLDPTYVYDLEDDSVTEATEYKGTVACFTTSRPPITDAENRWSKLKVFDGFIFQTVQLFIGNPPVHGGCETNGSMISWNRNGILYQYDAPYPNLPIGMNSIGSGATTGGSGNAGMVRTFDSGAGLYMSTGSGAGDGLFHYAGFFAPTASFSTSIADPQFPYGKIGRIKAVTVLFGKTASGGRALDMFLVDSSSGSSQVMSSVTEITASTMHQKFEATVAGAEFPNFQDLKLVCQWGAGSGSTSAPIIRRVDVEYETTNIEYT